MTGPLALIAGAGVAGLAAAWRLSRAGWRVRIVERAPDLRFGAYMIGLSGAGLAAAEQMGLGPRLQSLSIRIDENIYLDRRGAEIMRLKFRDFIGDTPFLTLRRTDLLAAMRDAIGDEVVIEFGRQIETIETGPDAATATLTGGERLTPDLLIGADGARSALRSMVFGPPEGFLTSLGCRFAVFDLDIAHPRGADFLSYAAPGSFAEYYALPGERTAALHVWRSARTGRVPADRRADEIRRAFAASHAQVNAFVDQAEAAGAPIILDDLLLAEVPRWSAGRVALLGDAAHSLSLISGQGAGMALAGASILAEEVIARGAPDGLAAYERRMRPAITRLQARSRRMAKVFIPQGALAFHGRNLAMRLAPRRWLGRYFSSAVQSEAMLARPES